MGAGDEGTAEKRSRSRWARLSREYLSRREFDRLVIAAIAGLPKRIRDHIENVDVVVEEEPGPEVRAEAGLEPGETLYGYYQGIPQQQRGAWYTMALPDKITIFRGPIMADCRTRRQVRRLVQSTVIHEIAHHFGIGDDELERMGWG